MRNAETYSIWVLARCYVADSAQVLGESFTTTLSGWIRSRSLKNLASCTSLMPLQGVAAPSVYHNGACFAVLLQIESFFKKNEDLDCGIDKDAAATESFYKSEQQCRRTNRRLDWYFARFPDRLSPEMARIIRRAQNYISDTLGPFEDFFRELPRYVRFSGGATATTSRRWSHPSRKLLKRHIAVTSRAHPYCDALFSSFNTKLVSHNVEYNRVSFVPKNFKTKRTIACEPEGNMPLQLSFDVYAKRQLARKRINLRCQERNQRDAHEGSKTGRIATVDFERASDTTALNAVWLLFPPKWARFLVDLRSPVGMLPDGSVVRYQKFSSMGNGTTFCVETLIFCSLCHAVGAKYFGCYGDDVTISSESANAFIAAAKFVGYSINTEKTYITGPYRESCGEHYFGGVRITPFFCRTTRVHAPAIALLVNGMIERVLPNSLTYDFLVGVASRVERRLLPVVPPNENPASGIIVDWQTAYNIGAVKSGPKTGWMRRGFRIIPKGISKQNPKQLGAYANWLAARYEFGPSTTLSPRGLAAYFGRTKLALREDAEPEDDALEMSNLSVATGRYKVVKTVWPYGPNEDDPPRIGAGQLAAALYGAA